jgi:hypothetical protein
MAYINLTQGKTTEIDDVDYPFISSIKWRTANIRGKLYAINSSKIYESSLHRLLLGASSGVVVDHIDGNGLNNKRSNLRLCSNKENVRYQTLSKMNTSGYKGVSIHKQTQKYRAQIRVNNRLMHLGLYTTKEEAAEAYNNAAIVHFGPFAKLNLIEKGECV